MSETQENRGSVLSWTRMDFEQRLGFRGGKYTDVNLWLAATMAAILVVLFYALMIFAFPESHLTTMFLKRPSKVVPFLIAFFSFWSASILYVKAQKLRLQQKALELKIVPAAHDFVLATATAPGVLAGMYRCVDNPGHFVLLSRIERALSNLSNIGRVSDVNEMLQSQASNDEDQMESSYTIVRGFIWGIPVLGFIGTVLGLSLAMAGFGSLLSAGGSIEALKTSLMGVTAGLATAFENTLEGLVAALAIQLSLSALKKKEERFLDDCKDYCHSHIISRLRLIHLDESAAPSE